MKKRVALGIQNFETMIEGNYFYVDKTGFLRDWWDAGDEVTLITRPRRFGKTLTMSMTECFFSPDYAGSSLFEGLEIWEEERFRKLQGTIPVLFLSFAEVKENTFEGVREHICTIVANLYERYPVLCEGRPVEEVRQQCLKRLTEDKTDVTLSCFVRELAGQLHRYYGKKVLILLDEYDTPMQEAYVHGFWEQLANFIQVFFHVTFKSNPYLYRGLMTGITRVSRESIFSDLNHLNVVTTISNEYEDSFGFDEREVFAALEEYELTDYKEGVKLWYDGYRFGRKEDIYNPWSILSFLKKKELAGYWVNTGGNSLISKLIWNGNAKVQEKFKTLLLGGSIETRMEERLIYHSLRGDETAIWSLLLAAGYLKIKRRISATWERKQFFEVELTNLEVRRSFEGMVSDWFAIEDSNYNDFIQALLKGNLPAMNRYMNEVALSVISYHDGGNHPSESEPERFYHGLVLGLIVELNKRYAITSNRESGFGRYDVLMEPLNKEDTGIILEFKVQEEGEKSLEETVQSALKQIEDKRYEQLLLDKGIEKGRIRKYGFAFCGKKVRIGSNE